MSVVLEANEWDAGLGAVVANPSLLQSWAWGEVQEGVGWSVERVALPGGGRASVQLRGRRLPWGYVPRGPVPADKAVLHELVNWARERGLVRLRVEPDAEPAIGAELEGLGFHPRPDAKPQQPLHSSLVPLHRPADALLAAFKPKTRYNIRLAERRGVQVETSADAGVLDRQAGATEARQGIRLPDADYYDLLLRRLPWSRLYVARHEGDDLAAILVARHAGRAYYLFGGSSGRKRELMPMYAAQWAAMSAAAEDGLAEYDLWGVPPPDAPDHAWKGLWQFKAGFNGRLVEYCGPWDVDLRSSSAAWLDRFERGRGGAQRVRRVFSTSANESSV